MATSPEYFIPFSFPLLLSLVLIKFFHWYNSARIFSHFSSVWPSSLPPLHMHTTFTILPILFRSTFPIYRLNYCNGFFKFFHGTLLMVKSLDSIPVHLWWLLVTLKCFTKVLLSDEGKDTFSKRYRIVFPCLWVLLHSSNISASLSYEIIFLRSSVTH